MARVANGVLPGPKKRTNIGRPWRLKPNTKTASWQKRAAAFCAVQRPGSIGRLSAATKGGMRGRKTATISRMFWCGWFPADLEGRTGSPARGSLDGEAWYSRKDNDAANILNAQNAAPKSRHYIPAEVGVTDSPGPADRTGGALESGNDHWGLKLGLKEQKLSESPNLQKQVGLAARCCAHEINWPAE